MLCELHVTFVDEPDVTLRYGSCDWRVEGGFLIVDPLDLREVHVYPAERLKGAVAYSRDE